MARERASRLASLISFQRPWTIDGLIRQISIDRARPIVVVNDEALIGAARLTGYWRPTDLVDYVHVSYELSEPAREYTILHEVGHILFDHPRPPDSPSRLRAGICLIADEYPTVPTSFIDTLNDHARNPRDSVSRQYATFELEAEWFALIVSDTSERFRAPIVANGAPPMARRIIEYYAKGLGW